MITSTEHSIEIDAPIAEAYAIVSDLSVLPRLLHGVSEVRRLDDAALEFVADAAGGSRRWDAVITEMNPEVSVAWTSRGDLIHSGVITLESVSAERTLVTLRIDHDPDTGLPGGTTGDLAGLRDIVRSLPPAAGHRRIVSLAAITQSRVTDPLGEPIGLVSDAYVDLDTHRVTAVAVSPGGSEPHILVPIAPTAIDEVARGVSLPHTREALRAGPAAEVGIEPTEEQLAAAVRHFAATGEDTPEQ